MNDFREYNNYLIHYGIKGMHWGIRRYQNPDGSLTDAGAKRYTREINADEAKYRQASSDSRMYKEKEKEAKLKGKTKKAEKFSKLSEASQQAANKYKEDKEHGIKDVLDSGYNLKSKTVNRVDRKYKTYAAVGAPFGAIGGGLAAAAYHTKYGKYRDTTATIEGDKFMLNGHNQEGKGELSIIIDMKKVENKMKQVRSA